MPPIRDTSSTFTAPRGSAPSGTFKIARVSKSAFGRAAASLACLSASNSGKLTQANAVRTSSLHVSAKSVGHS
eukprot:967248-Lingulodinium_polyedra.AAC.1